MSKLEKEIDKEIEEARKSVEEIEALERNSEGYIYDYFSNVKSQIDLRREKLKAEIDEYSDGLIQSVESLQDEFIKLSKGENEMSRTIEAYKKELDEIARQIDTIEISDKKFESIRDSLDTRFKMMNSMDLKQTVLFYKDYLIDNMNYDFIFELKPTSFGSSLQVKKYQRQSTIEKTIF